jgi:hypothetical protein
MISSHCPLVCQEWQMNQWQPQPIRRLWVWFLGNGMRPWAKMTSRHWCGIRFMTKTDSHPAGYMGADTEHLQDEDYRSQDNPLASSASLRIDTRDSICHRDYHRHLQILLCICLAPTIGSVALNGSTFLASSSMGLGRYHVDCSPCGSGSVSTVVAEGDEVGKK